MSLKLGILASSQQQAAPLLLDAYPGAVAAYSFRKLRSAYTGACCSIISSSGVIDIGFVNNYVDITAIQNSGLSDAYLVTWYDQSGNGNNIFRANPTGGRIKIANIIQTINGKVSNLYEPITGTNGNSNFNSINLKNGFSNFTTGKINTTTQQAFIFSKGFSDIVFLGSQNSNEWGLARDNVSFIARQANDAPTTYSLLSTYYDGLNGVIKHNGTIQATGIYSNVGTPNNVELTIPYNTQTGVLNNINITESIFYQSTQLANQSGIDANINSYYSIY